jgi:signal peptidase II
VATLRSAEGRQKRYLPILLTIVIILLDQLTKAAIVHAIPMNHIGSSLFGGLLRIVHVRNHGIAFSMGGTFSANLRSVLFIAFPIVVLGALVVYYVRSRELTGLERWAIAGILGGGVGNLIDRVFRPKGVVDFIDVKFFGIFGLERWPTFNVADSSVVVCGIILIIGFLIEERRSHEQED